MGTVVALLCVICGREKLIVRGATTAEYLSNSASTERLYLLKIHQAQQEPRYMPLYVSIGLVYD